MPTRHKRNESPYPEFVSVAQRVPRAQRVYLGETRPFGFRAYAEKDADNVWRTGQVEITKPDNSSTVEAVEPESNMYSILVEFNQLGLWELEFSYGHDSRPEEILKHRIYVRVVA